MRPPSYKALASDFLSKVIATDQDLCLDFNETPASEIISKRVNLQKVTPETDITAKFGLCIGLESLDLDRVLKLAKRVYFYFPATEPMWKWVKRLNNKKAKILSAEQHAFGYRIYATAYLSMDEVDELSQINISSEAVEHNLKENLALGLKEIEPHMIQEDAEIALVFGGPSINDFKDQIYEQAKSGMPVVTANGAYNWCLENKIIPAAQVVLDARAFNKRFVVPIQPNCKYLICSQCDPELVKSIPPEQLLLWHPLGEPYNRIVREHYKNTEDIEHTWYPVPGGTTVALRAIPLMMMLGYKKFHVYGLDSCIMDRHHGYSQPEDDRKRVTVWEYGGRKFNCYPWMAHQCNDFMRMTVHLIGKHCEMEVYGDGLIAHCIRTLAQEQQEKDDGGNEMDVLQLGEDSPSQRWIRSEHLANAHGAVQE